VVASGGPTGPELRLIERLADLAESIADRGALIDIPIGLPGGPHAVRSCDAAARRRLGRRSSSVFPTLSRAALEADSWAAANERNRAAVGKGLPVQSWGLVTKIREVDQLVRADARLGGRLRESHPELAFAWLNGGEPMARPKRDAEGARARLVLLESVWPGVGAGIREFVRGRAGVGRDDVMDALALLALAEAGAVPLPEAPPLDEASLPMEILVHPSLGAP